MVHRTGWAAAWPHLGRRDAQIHRPWPFAPRRPGMVPQLYRVEARGPGVPGRADIGRAPGRRDAFQANSGPGCFPACCSRACCSRGGCLPDSSPDSSPDWPSSTGDPTGSGAGRDNPVRGCEGAVACCRAKPDCSAASTSAAGPDCGYADPARSADRWLAQRRRSLGRGDAQCVANHRAEAGR